MRSPRFATGIVGAALLGSLASVPAWAEPAAVAQEADQAAELAKKLQNSP